MVVRVLSCQVDVSAAPVGKSWCRSKAATGTKVTLLQGFRMKDVLISRTTGPTRIALGVRGTGCLHLKLSWK